MRNYGQVGGVRYDDAREDSEDETNPRGAVAKRNRPKTVDGENADDDNSKGGKP